MKMVDVAKEAGCDQVKFQYYRTEDFILDRSLMWEGERQWDMFRRYEMTFKDLYALSRHCESIGVGWHATPTSLQGIDLLRGLGCEYVKNGSDFGRRLDMIRHMHKSGMTPILSIGMSTCMEVMAMLNEAPNAILLQCTSEYPTRDTNANIGRILTLKRGDIRVGYSDHTEGLNSAMLAVAAGAEWIETHITLNNSSSGPDHKWAKDPDSLKHYVDLIRTAETLCGDPSIRPTQHEMEIRKEWKGKRVI